MTKSASIILLILFISINTNAASPSPQGAELYFISPADGDVIRGPVVVRFGLKNMGIAPAGTAIENTGHHHLLINTPPPPLDKPIPNDDKHRHFGKGQTETVLDLAPGIYALQLLLGDYSHTPHDPPVISEKITITVK